MVRHLIYLGQVVIRLRRETVQKCFTDNNIVLLTGHRTKCIDHIAISTAYLRNKNLKTVSVEEWNLDKKQSDHKGIVVEIVPGDPD